MKYISVCLFAVLTLIPTWLDAAQKKGAAKPKAQTAARTGAAPVNLHVLITGIATLNHPSSTSVAVLDISVPKDEINKDHSPFIAADQQYNLKVYPPYDRHKETLQYDADGATHYFDVYWLDDAANLSLRVKNPVAGVQHVRETEPAGICGDASDTANMYFVPRVQRVLHNVNCQPNSDVRLRLSTPGGAWHAYVTNPFVQEFRPPLVVDVAMHAQQNAHLVDWRVVTTEPSLTLENAADSSVFATGDPDGYGRVVIVSGSAPKADLEKAVKTPSGKSEPSDPDFRIYYSGCLAPVKVFPYNTYFKCRATAPPDFAPLWMRRNVREVQSFDRVGGKRMS